MNDDGHEVPENADIVAPPPLIYAGVLIVGLLMNTLFPVSFLPRLLSRMLGWPLIFGGLLLGLLGFRPLFGRQRGRRVRLRPTRGGALRQAVGAVRPARSQKKPLKSPQLLVLYFRQCGEVYRLQGQWNF